MTHLLPSEPPRRLRGNGFWRKTWAMLVKEFIQLRRDRVSFAMIIMIPLVQLMLFGYAINTNPRQFADRGAAAGAERSRPLDPGGAREYQIFQGHRICRTAKPRSTNCSPRARCCSPWKSRRISSARCAAATSRRCWSRPTRTDPVAAGSALGALSQWCRRRSCTIARLPARGAPPFRNPHPCALQSCRLTPAQHRAWPGRHHSHHDHADLHCAVGDARDRARHHGDPARDAGHAGRDHARQDHPLYLRRLRAGRRDHRHRHPLVRRAGGRHSVAGALSTLFIAANLAVGYTFSTLAQNQLQAMQMSMMFFLPNILLSGFMFPFAGMPGWAQYFGEALPLTHFLRIVRAIMLKGSDSIGDALRRRGAVRADADRDDASR